MKQSIRKYLTDVRFVTILAIFGSIFFTFPKLSRAQCPTIDFSVPGSLCIGERVEIENLTSGILDVEWNFCANDLITDPTARSVQLNPSARGLYGLELINEDGLWLMFATDRDSNSLWRYTFGNGLDVNPTEITNLGDLGGLLLRPRAIKLYKAQDNWQGLILSTGNETLVSINFPEGLTNLPEGEVLLSGVSDPNSAMNFAQDGSDMLAFITYYSTSKIDIIKFKHTGGSVSVIETRSVSVPVSTNIRDIDLIRNCGNWYGIIFARRGRTVQKLRFGSNLFSVPTFENVPGNKNVRPMAGRFIYENGKYYAVALNENGDFVRLNFGNSISNDLESATNFGNLGILNSTRSIESIWDNGKQYIFTANAVTNELFSVEIFC